MATAQLLTLTHGVDDKVTRIDDEVKGVGDKVKDIGDTVRMVHKGARYLYIPTYSLVNVYAARWERNESNGATDSKRCDCNYATYGKQCYRSDESAFP